MGTSFLAFIERLSIAVWPGSSPRRRVAFSIACGAKGGPISPRPAKPRGVILSGIPGLPDMPDIPAEIQSWSGGRGDGNC